MCTGYWITMVCTLSSNQRTALINNKKYVLWNAGICPIASKVGHVTLVSSLKKIWFLSTGTNRTADFPSLYQIWHKNVDRRRNYGPKSKSKMAAVRHLGFVTSSHRTTHKILSLGHIGLSNFMLIRCLVLKIWRFEICADLAWNAYSRPKNFGFWGLNRGRHFRISTPT